MNKVSKAASKKKIKTNNKMLEDCMICAEKITGKGKRVNIECPACEFKCCKGCVERWLLDQLEPSCMSCKTKWTLVKCQELLGKGFMNGKHRKHVKEVLFDIEKARFPETMPEVEKVVKKERYVKENRETEKEIFSLQMKIRNLNKKISDKRYFIDYGRERNEDNEEKKEERKKFMKACPAADCEGFLSSSWKCGACDIWVCKDCEEIIGKDKDAPHECDPNILASAKLLKKETKPCPSCASSIYKISGCDQMWCTQCKIAFSWNTGKRCRGHIHNPHYYEWMKNGGGTVAMPGADMPCGGIPTAFSLRNSLKAIDSTPNVKKVMNTICSSERYVSYLLVSANLQYFGTKWYYNNKIYFPSDCGRRIESFDISSYKKAYEKGLSVDVEEQCRRFRLKYFSEINDLITTRLSIIQIYNCYTMIMRLHQAAQHFTHVELERQRRRVNNNVDSLDLRVKYILKRVDEKVMKTSLLKRERARNKEIAILDIYELYARVFADSLRSLCQPGLTFDKLLSEYKKLQRINVYCNEELLKYTKTFNLKTGVIEFRTGWVKTRGVDEQTTRCLKKGLFGGQKPDTIEPEDISVFDINMLKTYCRAYQNIQRFGRRWSCIFRPTQQLVDGELKYEYNNNNRW